ncbi:competence protein ComG [Bacillus sp. FJAT-18017]|uniref:competence type IV pilus assembly protein ComGB n=1 Tax=Bacillus sp. FJAT-18017 TaxID=1705566 RepID=UPI0006BD159D|nr:competence type IV pilus assembly protein ComGB [Bacillus sp. FJAT-18017]ALC92728.1 competence protein ComG [Bacillus sp. FJAT-18017]
MWRSRWTLKEQAEFLKRIGELLQRGYHISEAIESLSLQLPPHKKNDLAACLKELKNGTPFHEVIDGMHFNKELSGYVYFAEQHGNFEKAILEGSEALLNRDSDARKLRSLMYYPILLLAVTMILFIFVQHSLLPRFTLMFQSMGLQEHAITSALLRFGDILPLLLIIIALMAGVTVLLNQFWFRRLPSLTQRYLLMKVPILGKVFKLIHTHFFSIQLSYLLTGGLSIYEALTYFENHKKQSFYSELSRKIKSGLTSGETFESLIAFSPFFEHGFPAVVRHGQENGRLESELHFYSRTCLSSLEGKVKVLIKIIQPSIFLIVAALVISIYLAILLPMFHMLNAI